MSDTAVKTGQRLAALALTVLLTLGALALAQGGGKAAFDSLHRALRQSGLLAEDAASLTYTAGCSGLTLPGGTALATDGAVLDACVGANGSICYLCEDTAYRAVLTIADKTGEAQYRWHSASRYLTACALGENQAAAFGVNAAGESCLLRFSPEETEPEELALGNRTVFDLAYWDDTLCLVAEDGVYLLAGDALRQCGDSTPRAFAFGEEFAAVLTGDGVELYDKSGRTGRVAVEDAERLTACGRYFAVLTEDTAAVYTAGGLPVSETALDGGSCVLHADGSVTVLQS